MSQIYTTNPLAKESYIETPKKEPDTKDNAYISCFICLCCLQFGGASAEDRGRSERL